jgi:hypothetical protein
MPPDHDDVSSMLQVGKDTDLENSNDEARLVEPKLNNSVNDQKMNTTYCKSMEIAQTHNKVAICNLRYAREMIPSMTCSMKNLPSRRVEPTIARMALPSQFKRHLPIR